MRFFRSSVPVQKSGVVNPTRLSLLASLVLVSLVLLMTWARYRENEAARDIEAHQITNAVTHALLHQALSIPANPAFSPNRQDETEGAAEVRRESGKHMLIVQLDTLHATLAQTDKSGLYSQKDAPRLAKSIAQFLPPLRNHRDSALRGTLGGNDNARNTWLIHRGAAASGFAHINQKPFAVVAAPAQRINENGRHEAMAIVILADANEVLAPIVTRLARSSFIEFHTSPASASQRETMLYKNAGATVTISWQPSAPGDSRTAGQAAALSALAAFMIGLTSWYMTKRLTESEAQASRLAAEDILTGLPNRMLFVHFLADELQRYHRTGRGLALLYLDFDRFKEINDTFGHDGGDQLIIEASRRIASVLRSGDKLCRFGGDEFGIVQLDVNDISAPQHLSQRILDVMAGPFEIDGQSARIGVSIGIAMAPENSLERNELMRLADLALYRAKNNGRNCFVFYDEKMNMELQKRKAIEDELRAAIQNEELDVFYQPIVSTQTHKLTGVEALVRWPHQKRGLINPDDFISIAEERGLIFSLGEWVLRRACMDALHWPGIKLSVNISASQFRQANFVSSIKTILNETGFDPARLELELTESVVINDAQQAEEAMIELRSMGIRVALDDFGTGYSSLIYLRRFAIDKIKIDKSFLQTMEMSNEAEEIVGNIVDLGRRLGLTVTAEGVETPEQVAFLEATGCHELQGYLFGRPQPRLSVAALIGRDMISAAKPQTSGHRSQGPQAVRA